MARKVEKVTIDEPGSRDHGKTFVLTEMGAVDAEKWAARVLALLIQAGIKMPQEQAESGMAGLASVSSDANPAALLTALQDDSLSSWWNCVKYQHAPNHPLQAIIQGDGCQIEEMRTIGQLRTAVLNLHMGFFSAENRLTSVSRLKAMQTG